MEKHAQDRSEDRWRERGSGRKKKGREGRKLFRFLTWRIKKKWMLYFQGGKNENLIEELGFMGIFRLIICVVGYKNILWLENLKKYNNSFQIKEWKFLRK